MRAYAQHVKTLAIKSWPTILQSLDQSNQEVADTLVYEHYQKGPRPNLLEFLNLKDIKRLDQAVMELTKKEIFDRAQKERYNEAAHVNAITENPSGADTAVSLFVLCCRRTTM